MSDALAKTAQWEDTTLTQNTALREIALLVEDHMTEQGLSEAEKNAKTGELVEMVSDAVTAKLQPSARHAKPLQIAASRA